MRPSGYKPPSAGRLGIAAMVAALHLCVVAFLVHAFAPDLVPGNVRATTSAFDVIVTPEVPPPVQPSLPEVAKLEVARRQGAAAPAGARARPREVTAPRPKVALAKAPAPPVAGVGTQDSAGAADLGQGTGAGGFGQGTGAGETGSGTGGGGDAAKAVKIAGDIVSARDYPAATRTLRLGTQVTIAVSVGADGRPTDCRIVRPSRDPEADRVTCRLAVERFRFRPARDGAGQPIPSVYGWQQRWFAPSHD